MLNNHVVQQGIRFMNFSAVQLEGENLADGRGKATDVFSN